MATTMNTQQVNNATPNTTTTANTKDTTATNNNNNKAPPKPKRPLSAYNLYYRFKREKVIALPDASREDIIALIKTAPGLEDWDENNSKDNEGGGRQEIYRDHDLNAIRRENIRKDMLNNLLPRDTRDRSHRTNEKAINGAMTFLELGKLMNTSWQQSDEFAKIVFRELAEEGRELYRLRMEKYNALVGDPNTTEEVIKKCTTNASSSKSKKKSRKRSSGKRKNNGYGDVEGSNVVAPIAWNPASGGAGGAGYDNNMMPPSGSYNFMNQSTGSFAGPPSNMSMPGGGPPTAMMGGGMKPYHRSQQQQGYYGNSNNNYSMLDQGTLHARMQDLDKRLAQERLRARLIQLESYRVMQNAAEQKLKTEIEVLSRIRRDHGTTTNNNNVGGASATAVAHPNMPPFPGPQDAEQDGLLSLMSSGGMIPPGGGIGTSGGGGMNGDGESYTAMLKRMVARKTNGDSLSNGPSLPSSSKKPRL